MNKKTKMIKITSRGMVLTSRGKVFTPINHPYRESVDVIWSLITIDQADVYEKLSNGEFVKLTVQNFNKDNNIDTAETVNEGAIKPEVKTEAKEIAEEVKEEAPVKPVNSSSQFLQNKKNKNKTKFNQNQPTKVEEKPVEEVKTEEVKEEVKETLETPVEEVK